MVHLTLHYLLQVFAFVLQEAAEDLAGCPGLVIVDGSADKFCWSQGGEAGRGLLVSPAGRIRGRGSAVRHHV